MSNEVSTSVLQERIENLILNFNSFKKDSSTRFDSTGAKLDDILKELRGFVSRLDVVENTAKILADNLYAYKISNDAKIAILETKLNDLDKIKIQTQGFKVGIGLIFKIIGGVATIASLAYTVVSLLNLLSQHIPK